MNRSSFLKDADLQCIYSLGILRDITSLVNRLIYGEKNHLPNERRSQHHQTYRPNLL